MKKYILALIVSAIITVLTGCTHNSGPAGPLYGRWHLERIEADNMVAPSHDEDIYMAFQGQTVQLQRDNGNHSVSTAFGKYRLEDNTLFLQFPEADQPPFAKTGFSRENIMQVLKLTHKDLILLYNPEADKSLTYYFRKW